MVLPRFPDEGTNWLREGEELAQGHGVERQGWGFHSDLGFKTWL